MRFTPFANSAEEMGTCVNDEILFVNVKYFCLQILHNILLPRTWHGNVLLLFISNHALVKCFLRRQTLLISSCI